MAHHPLGWLAPAHTFGFTHHLHIFTNRYEQGICLPQEGSMWAVLGKSIYAPMHLTMLANELVVMCSQGHTAMLVPHLLVNKAGNG